jgi:hypothetical protein
MGKEKAGFLAPKAIANRIKAKGLQKLRWYCQMCQKRAPPDLACVLQEPHLHMCTCCLSARGVVEFSL